MKKNLIIFGAGGHSKSCIDIIENTKKFNIKGIIDNPKNKSKSFLNYPILGSDNQIKKIIKKTDLCFIGVGQIKNPDIRINIGKKIERNSFKTISVYSPNSFISKKSVIKDGTIIMNFAIVNTSVKIGKNCIINNRALIEHDSIIGDFCHISTGAIINGNVKVGDNVFIGSGTIINNDIEIGSNSIIGSGKLINKNIPKNSVIK